MTTHGRKRIPSTAPNSGASTLYDESFKATLRWLSPLPAPDRRWQAALGLAAQPRSAKRRSIDADVMEAVEFLEATTGCATDKERVAVQRRWPAISEALAIFNENSLRRWELEARVFAGQTNNEIAERCGMAPAVVTAYATWLFSHGREYIENPEWLVRKIFGPSSLLTFRNHEVGRFWAWQGLTEGPVMLDWFIDTFREAWRGDSPPMLDVYLRPGSPAPAVMAGLVAVNVLPRNKDTIEAWYWFALRIMEAQKDPLGGKEKFDRLWRDEAAYAFGFLNGKTARQLKRFLRQPRKQKDTSRESLIPKVPIDLSMLASGLTWPVDDKSKKLIEPSEPPMIEDVEQLLAAAVANGRSVPCHAEPEVKPLYGGLADLSELDRMLHCAASGNG